MSGPSLERFRAVAEAMGLARVVRSMEILGHALVDMREAPDAQVVLEIGAVRAVRPDLDSGMEALSERVSVLERAQSGAPAFPRPGAHRRRVAHRRSPMTVRPPPRTGAPGGAPTAGRGGQATLSRCRAAQQGSSRAGASAAPSAGRRRNAANHGTGARRQAPAPEHRGGCGGGDLRRRDLGQRERRRRSIATTSPRPGATASSSPSRQGPRRATPADASWRWTSRAPTSRCPTPRTGSSASNSRPMSRRLSPTTSGRRSRWCSLSTTAVAPPAAGPGPSPAASARPPGARTASRLPRRRTRSTTSTRVSSRTRPPIRRRPREARLLQAFPGASEVAD